MNKQDMVKNLIKVANHLDNERDFDSANELTRIAKIVVSMDDDMGGFNPDDFSGADDTESLEMELDTLLMDLNRAAQAGELDEEDIATIQNMLRSNKGLKTNEMSLDDDFELGLGAVPHSRIKNPMNSSDYDDEEGDIDLSLYEDDDFDPNYGDDSDYGDEDPGDPHAWQYEDVDDEDDEDDLRRDENHQENAAHYFYNDDEF